MEGRPRIAVNAFCVPFNFCVICSYNTDFSASFATDFSGLRITSFLLNVVNAAWKAWSCYTSFKLSLPEQNLQMLWARTAGHGKTVFVESADESKEGPEYIPGPFNTGDWF